MKRCALPFIAILVLAAYGCHNRNADDRVTIDEETRQVNRGPGYTAVAVRRVDRARLSNGVVIINQSGEEPVYVTDAGYYRAPPQDVKARSDEMKDLLETVDQLRKAIRENRNSAPETQRLLRECMKAYNERPEMVNPNTFGPKTGTSITPPPPPPIIQPEQPEKPTLKTSAGNPVKTSNGGDVNVDGGTP